MPAAATKLSVTVPSDLARDVKRHVGDRGLSGFVATALRHELERRKLGAYLRALDRKHGPVPAAAMARARRAWPAR